MNKNQYIQATCSSQEINFTFEDTNKLKIKGQKRYPIQCLINMDME
jgi:hypothetical protein